MKTNIFRTFRIMSFLLRGAPAFFFTTYQLFLAENGMNIFDMSIINGAYMISVFILEVPTGAFADSFGRKLSIITGCIAFGLSCFIYFLSTHLAGFIIAEIVGALGTALISGALDAWTIDSLANAKVDYELEDLFRQEEKAKQAGVISGSMLGALAGSINLELPWILSGAAMFAAAICAGVMMSEPGFKHRRFNFDPSPIFKTARDSWLAGRSSPAFLRLAAIGTIFAMSVQSLNMQWSLFFTDGFKLPVWSLGLIFAGIAMVTALGARLAPLAARKTSSEGRSLAIAFLLIGITMIISGHANFLLSALTFFLLHEFGRGLFSPLKKAIINRRIDGQNRATMLSLESMSSHAGAFVGLLGGGWLGTQFSVSFAWSGSGILLLILVPWLWKKGV